jgi:hypothetical protein
MLLPHPIHDDGVKRNRRRFEPVGISDVPLSNKAARNNERESIAPMLLAIAVMEDELDLRVFELADSLVELLGVFPTEHIATDESSELAEAEGNGVGVWLSFEGYFPEDRLEDFIREDRRVAVSGRNFDDKPAGAISIRVHPVALLGLVLIEAEVPSFEANNVELLEEGIGL